MDGYAVRAADTQNAPVRLRIVGESAAGSGWHQEMKVGEAVRIMTGAPLPKGADSVQQVELTKTSSRIWSEIQQPVSLRRSIVTRGAEVQRGAVVLQAGEQLMLQCWRRLRRLVTPKYRGEAASSVSPGYG